MCFGGVALLESVTEGRLRDEKAFCCCQDALLGAHGQDVSSLSFLLYQPCLLAVLFHYNHKANEHFLLLKNSTHCNRDVQKHITKSWRTDSGVNCSSIESSLDSHHPCGDSQPSITPFSGDLILSSG